MIYAKLKEDMITARRARESRVVTILSSVIGEINNKAVAIDPKAVYKEYDDESVIKVLKSLHKAWSETNKLRPSRELERELEIIEAYLPQQMSKEDLIEFFNQFEDLNTIGDYMGYLKKYRAGQYDGKLASQVYKEMTS